MKIKTIKLANQVKVGSAGFTSITDNGRPDKKNYDIELINGVLVKISNGTDTSFTSLFNTIYFIPADNDSSNEEKGGSKGISKAKK